MPDYFVPIDTTLYTDYHRKLVGKGVIIKFTMKFIEDHRKELADKYKKFESLQRKVCYRRRYARHPPRNGRERRGEV